MPGRHINGRELYEKPELREIAGSTLRPGGLRLTRKGLELCAFRPGDKILDLGCGPGESLAHMRSTGLCALGLDKSPLLLGEAAAHGPVLLAGADKIPLLDGALDGLLAECVLSLMPDKPAVLREVRRVLKNGGKLLLSDLFLRHSHDDDEPAKAGATGACCLKGAMPLPRLQEMLREAGLTPLHCFDESRSLREMAANMAWCHGSVATFFQRWGAEPSCGRNGKNLGYVLIIAKATE